MKVTKDMRDTNGNVVKCEKCGKTPLKFDHWDDGRMRGWTCTCDVTNVVRLKK